MLDSRRVEDLKLRITDTGAELPLHEGVQAIARDAAGLHAAIDGNDALVRFCLDRRGVWLAVAEGVGSVHVNGRRVRRMAMLRVGDAVYVDGAELVLTRDRPSAMPAEEVLSADPHAQAGDVRVVLRGVGGKHHGRSFTLEHPRLVGSAVEADIRIDDPAFAEHHAQISQVEGQVLLRDLGTPEGSQLNGQPVRDAVLEPGDQIVFDSQHRFVVEAPGRTIKSVEAGIPFDLDAGIEPPAQPVRSWRRWPWLLLAALLTAAALAALLLFGSAR